MIRSIAFVLVLAGTAHASPVASEDTCRAIAQPGKTWEDTCQRVYGIDPSEWDLKTGKRVAEVAPAIDKAQARVTAAKATLASARADLKKARAAAKADARKARDLRRAAKHAADHKADVQ